MDSVCKISFINNAETDYGDNIKKVQFDIQGKSNQNTIKNKNFSLKITWKTAIK